MNIQGYGGVQGLYSGLGTQRANMKSTISQLIGESQVTRAEFQEHATLTVGRGNGASKGKGIGGVIGSILGGVVGTIVAPGIGTQIGAALGGLLGGGIGGAVGGSIGESQARHYLEQQRGY